MEPVQPFVPPVDLAAVWSRIDMVKVISITFTVLFIIWCVYTLVTAYHWLRYGHRSAVAIPALITHVLISGYLALFAISGLHP